MSDISLKKPFRHFATSALFGATKVSVNAENTSYIQNGEVHEGTPEILWEHTVFIHDIAQIWNRGRYYNSQKYLGKLAAITKNSFQAYSGMTIVTLVDKNPQELDASLFQNYPGILPSIVIAPGTITDIDHILSLADKGCDILSTAFNGTSVYDSAASKDLNYDNILDDMVLTEQWLVEHGLFTNCYKYPDAAKANGESEFIQRYEEFGVVEDNVAANGLYQDNMLLHSKTISSDAGCSAAATEIGADTEGSWFIYVIDTENISSSALTTFVEAIQDGIDNGTCIYMQMHEGLQMRASEFNVGRSENTMPFRVYKDGKVDADLTASALEHVTETVGSEIAQTLPGEGLTYNGTTGKLDWTYTVSEEVNGSYDGTYIPSTYATYVALEEVSRIVSEALAEFKTTYLDQILSEDNLWQMTYFMSEHYMSYLNSKGECFLQQD